MSKDAEIKFTWDTGRIKQLHKDVLVRLEAMGNDIAGRGAIYAPVLTGALKNSFRTNTDGDTVWVLVGGEHKGNLVDYAELREYHNPKHPETTHYFHDAFEEVTRDPARYFKGITQ